MTTKKPGALARRNRAKRCDNSILTRSRRRTKSLADCAQAYVALGYRVFPCKPDGKTPLTKHGVKDATTDANQIRKWWTKWPNANIGLGTGNGLVVIDVDPGKGGDESLAALEAELGPLSRSWCERTGGGGLHIFLSALVGCEIRNRVGLHPGIDVRGDGGYVVVTPSVHESGCEYELLTSIPTAGPEQISTDWLLKLRTPSPVIRTAKPAGAHRNANKPSRVTQATLQQIERIIARELNVMPNSRHLALLRLSAAFNRLPELRNQPAEFFFAYLESWFSKSSNIRAGFHETYTDFCRMWRCQDHNYKTPPELALDRARAKPYPAIASRYALPEMKLLIALCCELQATCANAAGVWFLSVRTVAVLIGMGVKGASKLLLRLRFDRVIEHVVASGTKARDAFTYRYIASTTQGVIE